MRNPNIGTTVIPLRPKLANHGKRWDSEDMWRVITMYSDGETWEDIARRLRRSETACRTMVAKIKWAYSTKRTMDELIYAEEVV